MLREVDQHEKDFKEMFSYLNDVEEMLSGTELGQIKKMKDISSTRMVDHVAHYEQIQKEMTQLAEEAVKSMSDAAYDPESQELAKEAQEGLGKYK